MSQTDRDTPGRLARITSVSTAAAELVRQDANGAAERASHLTPARERNGFALGKDRVDVRDWPVFASDARLVGVVDRLMVESWTGRIRYVSVALTYHASDDHRPNACGSVLVPIGLVRRLDDRRAIVIDALTSTTLVNAPRLRERPVTRADEYATLAVYGLAASLDVPGRPMYGTPQFDERPLQSVSG